MNARPRLDGRRWRHRGLGRRRAGPAGRRTGPPPTITSPPRDFGPGGVPTTYFWHSDIIAVDPSFNDIAQPNAPIQRLYTGLPWPMARRGARRADAL
jgi:gluconolactonase